MNNGTIVTVHRSENCVQISTFSAKNGRSPRFFICVDTMRKHREESAWMSEDCGHVLSLRFDGDRCVMDFRWLSETLSGKLSGRREVVTIPRESLEFLAYHARGNSSRKVLAVPRVNPGTISFTESAQRVIGKMPPRVRRAFCKAMARGRMVYPGTHTDVYNDPYEPWSFGFRTDDGLVGGLILHETKGRMEYSVHT